MNLKYDSKDDPLQRRKIAKQYVQFINKLQGNHTIALDAPWGSGKTTLIDFMSKEFDKKEDLYIIYNAWKNDYTNDPFLSLMSEFFEEFPDENEDTISLKEKCINLSRNTGKMLVKAGASYLKNDDIVDDIENNGVKKAIESLITDSSKEFADYTFKNIAKNKKSRTQFSNKLEERVSRILKEKNKDKLIIIIDELDRCKPTFAIELLENIKHLFAIDELIFFIAIDRTQLSESIKVVYGSGFDSDTYLHRFFDLDIHLPKTNIDTYFKKIIKEKFHEDVFIDGNFEKLIPNAINSLGLTLRDFQRIISETLLLKELNESKVFYEYICIVLLMIKYKRLDLYTELKGNQRNEIEDVINNTSTFKTPELYTFWSTHVVNTLAPKNQKTKKDTGICIETFYIMKLIDTTL